MDRVEPSARYGVMYLCRVPLGTLPKGEFPYDGPRWSDIYIAGYWPAIEKWVHDTTMTPLLKTTGIDPKTTSKRRSVSSPTPFPGSG